MTFFAEPHLKINSAKTNSCLVFNRRLSLQKIEGRRCLWIGMRGRSPSPSAEAEDGSGGDGPSGSDTDCGRSDGDKVGSVALLAACGAAFFLWVADQS